MLKVIIAGEVDAGKSTLIGRFMHETGSVPQESIKRLEKECFSLGRGLDFAYLTDSFEEERKGNLTLDTAQAYIKMDKGKNLLFIDVPGHNELLNNMFCGSSLGNACLLTADVRHPVTEQAKAHLEILNFLRIREIVVALNKMDLAGYSQTAFLKAAKQLVDILEKAGMSAKQFIPLCAKLGENFTRKSPKMPWYKGPHLAAALNRIKISASKNNSFYFPIQDVYNQGSEKLYVGTILSGSLKNNEIVASSLKEGKFRISCIKKFTQCKHSAKEGEPVGISFDGPSQLNRGDILYKVNPPIITREFLAEIFLLKNTPLNNSLIFRCLGQVTPAEIKKTFSRGKNTAKVMIRTQKPVAVKSFEESNALGRFILNDGQGISYAGLVC